MSQYAIFARPYAKATFEYALKTKALADWGKSLEVLAYVVLDPAVVDFISNPRVTQEQALALLLSPFSTSMKSWDALTRWLHLIVEQQRVLVLPEIYLQYQFLRAEHEKTLAVEVFSYMPMSSKQTLVLKERLSKRLQRDVDLQIVVDPTLIGGAVIKAGDMVIDGSVLGRLRAMAQGLLE